MREELQTKVEGAVVLVRRLLSLYSSPVVLSSFGKDSMVLLEVVRRAGAKLPILFFRESRLPQKYAFANSVILANDYEVHDYPPFTTVVVEGIGELEVVNLHGTRRGSLPLYLPTGIVPSEFGVASLCGLWDIYGKPTAKDYRFPWDLLLIGHKSSDVDPVLGRTRLTCDLHEDNPAVAFPLRHFTDADVWEFTEEAGLPINELRYDRASGWKEFSDTRWNPDYFPACTACMERDRPGFVWCQRSGKLEASVAHLLRRADEIVLPPYLKREEGGERKEKKE